MAGAIGPRCRRDAAAANTGTRRQIYEWRAGKVTAEVCGTGPALGQGAAEFSGRGGALLQDWRSSM